MKRRVVYLDDVASDDYICESCGERCYVTLQDFGIGSFEFWGATGNDERWEFASECCGDGYHPYEHDEASK